MSSIPFWFKTTFALGQETGAIKVGTLKHTLPIYLVFFAPFAFLASVAS